MRVKEDLHYNEYKYTLPPTYLSDCNKEVLLEPGDLVIRGDASWNEILDALADHASMADGGLWLSENVVHALEGCL